MQGGYDTRRCKQLRQLTEASSNAMPQDTGLMNKTSGAPQSGTSISWWLQMKLDCNTMCNKTSGTKDLLMHLNLGTHRKGQNS